MSVTRDNDGFYRSALLRSLPWLTHAFGTAQASPAEPYCVLKQVHSATVIRIDAWREGIEADGIVAASPGETLAVKSADCVPILIADPRRRAIAAIHAGWRGTIAGIAGNAVTALAETYGSEPSEMIVALGPSIQQCCFEISADVGVLFRQIFPERNTWADGDHIDLQEANRRVLLNAGVGDQNISLSDTCTCCGGAEFYSWRRDHRTGCRMYSVIAIRP